MGDRALVIFRDEHETSPTVYLHWSGGVVPELIEETKALMTGRFDDVQYACARFIGVCHARNPTRNTGLGVWSTNLDEVSSDEKLEKYSHGDAGVVVVDVRDFSWKAYGGYLARPTTA